MNNIAHVIAASLIEAEHYKRKTSAAKSLHGVREAAGSACNIASNTAYVAPAEMEPAALAAQGITGAIASDLAKLHRIASDAAALARVRFREQRDEVTAGWWGAMRDRYKVNAITWEAHAARLMEV